MASGLRTEYRIFAGLGLFLVGYGIYQLWVGVSTPAGWTVFGVARDVLAGLASILGGGSAALAARHYYQRRS